jgi:hypothetical protein
LIGIVMGSSVALLTGLSLTLVVFLLMPGEYDRLSGEFGPLLQAIAWAVLLVSTSVASFLGQLKLKPWRIPAQLALAAALALVTWAYWPR